MTKHAFVLLLTFSAPAFAAEPRPARAFVGARLWEGRGQPIADATLVVRDGKVEAAGPSSAVAVPKDAERISLAGKTIIPGLVNAHAHVGETRGLRSGAELYSRENVLDQLGLYARYGVTSVVSLGGDQEAGFRIRDAQDSAALDRARLFVSGPLVEAATPEAARAQVAALAARKPDWVKIRVDDNLGTVSKMPAAVSRAVIEEAHRHGLRVAAHVFYLEDARALLDAGVDLIAHSVRDSDLDPALVAAFKSRGVCLVPTLTREVQAFVYGSEPDFFADPFFLQEADASVLAALRDPERQKGIRESAAAARYRKALEVASRNLKALSAAGAPIAFGTDSGPPARFQGYFEHLELELMVKAGLTPPEALTAATSGAARCLGLTGKVGTLERGAWADFIVLNADPLADIRNTRRLESVWIAGNRVKGRGSLH
jgi:imidazolonepropionase-like amidohydrolase